jgi:nucleotide-binding universal stress UspA family protein
LAAIEAMTAAKFRVTAGFSRTGQRRPPQLPRKRQDLDRHAPCLDTQGMSTVIAAIDLGPSSGRVLYHAAGMARLMSARLEVLHVSGEEREFVESRVLDFCRRVGPYEIDPAALGIVARSGTVSDTIYREARNSASLVVMGSRGHRGLADLFLGSSSKAFLRDAPCPVLLVPPTDLDIVNMADRAALTCGPVLAAIDLTEACEHQLQLAAEFAVIARQPLLLMTVAAAKLSVDAATERLRERARQARIEPHALIVRRGRVAEEISRCALQEGAGLVVMGLRSRPRSTPGVIAAAVLKTKRAFVLAVPGC